MQILKQNKYFHILFLIGYLVKDIVSSQGAPRPRQDWNFQSTALDQLGRVGRLGDACDYDAWDKHSKPIIEVMMEYIKVKTNLKKEYAMAKKEGKTSAEDAYAYVHEIALKLSDVRKGHSVRVQARINSRTASPTILKDICDGGELLHCKRHNEVTNNGTCKCFDIEELKSNMYKMKEEDGHCKGVANATCNPDDPVGEIECADEVKCTNLTVAACRFAYGEEFHCTGESEDGTGIGTQNMFCSRPGHQPENANDIGSGGKQHAVSWRLQALLLILSNYHPLWRLIFLFLK